MAIKPSPHFAMFLLLVHTIAAVVVYAAAMPILARCAIILLIVLSLIYYLARDVLLLLPDSWRELALNQNTVSVLYKNGSSLLGQLANKTIVSPFFVVLRVKSDSHLLPISRVIFPDALGRGEFRDLCIRLKFA